MSKPFGFLSKHHIRHASEFSTVFKRGKRDLKGFFAVYHLATERDHPRLGMVINKRNCVVAADRNRIKRLIREQFRLNQHVISAVDVVVMLKVSANNVPDRELCECIEKLFLPLITQCAGSSSQ